MGMLQKLEVVHSTDKQVTLRGEFQGIIGPVHHSTIDLPMSVDEFLTRWCKYIEGDLIQNCFENLDADQREWFLTGEMIPPEFWEQDVPENAE